MFGQHDVPQKQVFGLKCGLAGQEIVVEHAPEALIERPFGFDRVDGFPVGFKPFLPGRQRGRIVKAVVLPVLNHQQTLEGIGELLHRRRHGIAENVLFDPGIDHRG